MTILTDATRLAQLVAVKQENQPIIAWNTQTGAATLGGTATLTDGDRANAITGTTYDYWLPNVTGTTARMSFTWSTARTISCAAIAAHNIGTLGASVQIRRSINAGVSWSDAGLGIYAPPDDTPIMWRMLTSGADAADWDIVVSGLTPGAPLYIGVIFMGTLISPPTRMFSGFSPVVSPTEVALQSNVSVGGNLLGSSVISSGSRISAQFNYVDQSFARGSLKSFMPHFNAGKGFFFGWRPTAYADDLHYCWREGEALRFTNMGALDLVQFGMQMRAYEG